MEYLSSLSPFSARPSGYGKKCSNLYGPGVSNLTIHFRRDELPFEAHESSSRSG